MLDQETKRKIDNARDILVGKVPDPKSQVEQITIALIYKFMDDMDKESVALGGKAAFFKGEYEKYTWSRIFDPKLGGFDLITLYSEAITTMNHNENIPQLFRDIFKNAFLPYRDPETLKSFLKEINEFKYDHSEKLGDAFEYLLSVLGSQGDAGQFRTPRHIIDFIVSVVDPQKNESILDPACGTAGFLISSFKHILSQNTKERKGDSLTTDERKRLMNNLVGYDISPDMVRLSLVNMYLHGFQTPKIYEYDTLTSEEKWNETYDVILANPPFMTPKGGIRPHKRFSVQANRSEVLFVDYIMEHISTNGRGGVIVPEGIIFQSANAYKALRKLLVDTHLFAVVSLPSGVFQPYSGVKTSILLMDRTLAKRASDILFVKIESDGFDPGAQRRPNGKSELTVALSALLKFRRSLNEGKEFEFSEEEKRLAHRVARVKIAEGGDYNLSGERYKEVAHRLKSDYPMVEFDKVCSLEYGASLPEKERIAGEFPVVGSNGITGWHNKFLIEGPAIIVGRKGSAGEVAYIDKPCFPIDTTYFVKINKNVEINFKYLYFILKELNLTELKGGGAVPGLNRNDVYTTRKIPLPPLSVQQEIVAEIEGYQKIIDGARQVVENYKPKIKVDEGWEVVELGDVCETTSGGTPSRNKKEFYENGNIPWLKSGEVDRGLIYKSEEFITEDGLTNSSAKIFPINSVLIAMYGATAGKVGLLKFEAATNQAVCAVLPTQKFNPEFMYLILKSQTENLIKLSVGGAQPNLSQKIIQEIKIPLPPLDVQKEIVARIEEEQKLVDANKKLIELFEEKIKTKIAEVWG
ncbi:MAG: restriction endonuclease subunit S [Candidatus Methanoperedenaceae archaeon]|nr:restriction endonuclease subunit S [Candidatus Methanoperedenaceae archaeon]